MWPRNRAVLCAWVTPASARTLRAVCEVVRPITSPIPPSRQIPALLAVADALPVTVLAVIAGAGSFTHIRDTAAQPGPYRLGHCGLHRPDLRHGRPRTTARQAARHRHPSAVVARRRARGRGTAEPGRQPLPGAADRLGPDRGRRPAPPVPRRGLP